MPAGLSHSLSAAAGEVIVIMPDIVKMRMLVDLVFVPMHMFMDEIGRQ
jgi:hypothetical protein